MKKSLTALALSALLFTTGSAVAADYKIDKEGQHAFVNFRIQHLGYSWLYGTFKDFDGTFTFDERMGERISDDVIAHCHQCGTPCDSHTNCLNDGCHLLFIQCPACAEKFSGCCSVLCQEERALPEEEQRRRRAGRENGNKIFNKSRGRLNTTLGIPDPE